MSAPKIVGQYFLDKPSASKDILYEWARSDILWERRIAIISTMAFIKISQFNDTLAISEMLLKDKHDLIHKAVGWMLREVGKKDESQLEQFLNKHCLTMPRTMLRYAIERLEADKRRKYMEK